MIHFKMQELDDTSMQSYEEIVRDDARTRMD